MHEDEAIRILQDMIEEIMNNTSTQVKHMDCTVINGECFKNQVEMFKP